MMVGNCEMKNLADLRGGRIELASRFNLYDPEAVIKALRQKYQIEAFR